MKSKIITHSLGHAALVLGYIELIILIGPWAGEHMGRVEMQGLVLYLLLLVISASVMGVLVFGKPVAMFLNGERKEAVYFLLATIGWIIVVAVVFFAIISGGFQSNRSMYLD